MTSTLGASPQHDTEGQSGALTHAKDVALEKTEEVRAKVGGQLTSRVRDQADERSTMLGEQVSSIASALKSTASRLEQEGQTAPANAVHTVTEQVERVGEYLTGTNGEQLLHDLEDQARKRPWAVAATLFGLGFAASRVLSASSRERYKTRAIGTGTTSPALTSGGATRSEFIAPHTYGGGTNGNY